MAGPLGLARSAINEFDLWKRMRGVLTSMLCNIFKPSFVINAFRVVLAEIFNAPVSCGDTGASHEYFRARSWIRGSQCLPSPYRAHKMIQQNDFCHPWTGSRFLEVWSEMTTLKSKESTSQWITGNFGSKCKKLNSTRTVGVLGTVFDI